MKDFEDNLEKQFENLTVSNPDESKHLEHLYADYVELVALFASKTFVSTSDILDRLKDEGAITKSDELTDEDAAPENDKNEAWVGEIFRILEERSVTYGNDYPFDYANRRIVLREIIEFKHQVYIFMLISSNLAMFKSVSSSLTSDFEAVSFNALSNYLSEKAIVKQFGKQSAYTGTARQKIQDLARDLKIELNEAELSNVSIQNNMERGLDLIGWLPFADECPNMLIILGQCACGRNWASKYHDTRRFENYFVFYKRSPIHAMFIPYSLVGRQGGREFYRSDEVEKDTLLFERRRISSLYCAEQDFLMLESKKIVEKCLNYVEDIV